MASIRNTNVTCKRRCRHCSCRCTYHFITLVVVYEMKTRVRMLDDINIYYYVGFHFARSSLNNYDYRCAYCFATIGMCAVSRLAPSRPSSARLRRRTSGIQWTYLKHVLRPH